MDPKSLQPRTAPPVQPTDRGVGSVDTGSATRQRDAALSVVRGEIDAIYRGDDRRTYTASPSSSPTPNPIQQPQRPASTPQARAAQPPQQSAQQTEEWKKYHSAWQTYYQKYYEQYYVNEVRKNIATQKTQARQRFIGGAVADIASRPEAPSSTGGILTQNEALQKIRQNIIDKAQESAKKVRKSRHFIPIAAALSVAIIAFLLQYNQLIIANVKAYVSPSSSQSQNIIIDPNTEVPVGPENKMIIPKINVDAPVVFNVGPSEAEQLAAMANGIAHVRYAGALALPGQVGNTVFSAHSSSDWSDVGAYKFIFVQLERLVKDDVIYINYNSKRYAYKVYETKVVSPTDTAALRYTGNDPILTLITCTPLGTAHKRFLVFAKQVSPDPQTAQKVETPANLPQSAPQFAGTSPTLLERLFGIR